MPQRLRQTTAQDGHPITVGGASLVAAHAQLVGILSSRLGRGHAELLATPLVQGDGSVSWSTPLSGPAVAASGLDAEALRSIEARAERMLNDIRGLAGSLQSEGGASALVGQLLERAARRPPGDWLYSVGGKPVLVMWGHSAGAESDAAPASAAAVASGAAGAAMADAAPAASPARSSRRWMLWGLVALLPIGLLLTLARCASPAAENLSEQIAQAEKEVASIEEQIAKRKSEPSNFQCVPDPPPPVASAPEAASAPEPASAPSAPAPKPEPKKTLADARKMCPGERPPEFAPEIVMVFDASGSMDYGIDVTDEQVRQAGVAEGLAFTPMLRSIVAQRVAALRAEPRRITAAKSAALSAAKRLPSDASVGLVLVDECPAASSQGFFPPKQRGSLLSKLQGVEPNKGTPLADGVRRAGQLVDGVKRDALMLVISDGAESCNGDPCAEAAALARAKPNLRINVVDITGAGAGNCLASATHGKVFTARNAEQVAQTMKQAVQDAMPPAKCAKN